MTEIGFGAGPLGGMPDTYGHDVDEETARATVRAIFDGPVNLLDTSRNYGLGRSEARIGACRGRSASTRPLRGRTRRWRRPRGPSSTLWPTKCPIPRRTVAKRRAEFWFVTPETPLRRCAERLWSTRRATGSPCSASAAPTCLAQALTIAPAARVRKESVNPRIPTVAWP